MTETPSLPELVDLVRSRGILRTPPLVLLTRWQLLIGDEKLSFFDVAHDAGTDIPGTRYAFVGVSQCAICYLAAEHDDDMWEHDPHLGRTSAEITPRLLITWRRPLRSVTEVSLSGGIWDWLPDDKTHQAQQPCVVFKLGDSEVQLPLPSTRRQQPAPDIAPALLRVREAWGNPQTTLMPPDTKPNV